MTVSLNAGAELDDEISALDQQQLEQATQLADAVFDVSTEESAIAAMEARLDDLRYLLEDIHKSHGMSQSFALEAERLMPGFNDATPIGYYTKTPTATQLKVSLEEINKGIWVGIAAIAAAVIAMIWKFISWLTGSDTNSNQSSAFRKADKALDDSLDRMKQATGMREAVEDLDPGNIPIFDEHGNPQYAGDRTEMIKKLLENAPNAAAMKELLENPPAIYYDIMTDGPYTVFIEKVAHEIPEAAKRLIVKVELILDKWRLYIGRTDEFDTDDITPFYSLSEPLTFKLPGYRTQNDILNGLKNSYQQLYADRSPKHDRVTIEGLLKGIEKGYKSKALNETWIATEAVVKICKESETLLHDMQGTKERIDIRTHRSGDGYNKIEALLADSMRHTLAEVATMVNIAAMLQKYRVELQRFEEAVRRTLQAFIIRLCAQKPKGGEDPAKHFREIQKLRRMLEEAGKKYSTNYPIIRHNDN